MDPAFVEVLDHGNEVAQAAGYAVEFPDGERVAVFQCFEAMGEGRALDGGSGIPIGENLSASGPLQRLQLHVGVLVNGGYACIAVFHCCRASRSKGLGPASSRSKRDRPRLPKIVAAQSHFMLAGRIRRERRRCLEGDTLQSARGGVFSWLLI